MAKNRGKEFEALFRKATETLQYNGFQVDIQRLFDVVGKKTIEQPADFICYYMPNQIYVECKSTSTSSFSFESQPQYPRLLEKSKINGIRAGMLVWFVEDKRVFWFDIRWLNAYNKVSGKKSFSVSVIDKFLKEGIHGIYEIDQTTQRVKPEMRLEGLFKYIVREK